MLHMMNQAKMITQQHHWKKPEHPGGEEQRGPGHLEGIISQHEANLLYSLHSSSLFVTLGAYLYRPAALSVGVSNFRV